MKTKAILISLIGVLAITTTVFQACKKTEENTNQPPTCKITSPLNGQEITKGESVTISVEANDSDGTITEVRFSIDGVGKGSASSYPYNYNWNTDNEDIGNHTLKATSVDNGGTVTTDEIDIFMTEGGSTGTFTDPRDDQTYTTIDIGSQTWFAENLNYNTGDGNNNSWCYDNNGSNCDIYGRLYTWEAATSACPDGWHLPSDDEWTTLIDFLGGEDVAGGKMKETGTTHWNSPNTGATNSSGFTALPGGYRNTSGGFYGKGYDGYWWSATGYSSTDAWSRRLYYDNDGVARLTYSKEDGFSVRCVRD
jgi:uncharacterized protein (TIGR02145 family)